jgi:hypothetical protein
MAPHVFGGALPEKDLGMMERCGIPRDLAEEAARRVDSVTGAAMFGRPNDLAGDYAGIVFLDRLPGENEIREYTLRRDQPDLEDAGNGKVKEKNKYVSPPGRSNLLYFAPRTAPEWLEDRTLLVIVTEGPKKCLALSHLAWEGVSDAADKPRWLSIGLKGVWSWRGKVGKQDAPDGERQDIKGPIPDLNRINWTKRQVVILFDANVHSNESVRAARATLAAELRSRGACVLFVDLPADCGVNGVDDYIGKNGPDSALKLISGAYDPRKKKSDSGQPSKIVIGNLPDVCHIASEKVEFLVPGLLVKGTLTVLSGEASAGKTTLALWLADLIARGAAVFGERCQQHPVLYLTRENPVDYMADIVRRLKIKNGQDSNLHIWGDWVEESAPAPAAAHILAWVRECQPPPFIIIDSLIAFFDGKNENDSAEMRAFLNQGRALMRAGACGVLFLHHPGKAESAKVYRGSSDLGPAIDAGYVLHNSGDGILERLHLKLFKPRFLAQKRELLLEYHDGGFTSEERPALIYESVTQQLIKLLAGMPGCTKKQFLAAAMSKGLTQQKALRFLDDGVACGSIQRDEGSHNKQLHTLAATDTVQ